MSVIELSRAHATETLDVLCASFHDYPVMRYVVGDTDRYAPRVRTLITFFLESRLTRGMPVLGVRDDGGRLAGVALLVQPSPPPWPPELTACYEALTDGLGADAVARLERYADAGKALRPDRTFYFLGMLAVRPDAQGRGHGRRLLDAVAALSARHPESQGVCLDTEDPKNVDLYRHVGYTVVGEADVGGGLHTWCMFRPDDEGR